MGRSPEEIQRSMEENRAELALAVESLRSEVQSITDWRGFLRAHRKEALIAAGVAGFVLGGGLVALRNILR